MSTEQWRAVSGYEGMYEVSDLGRVRSLDRLVRSKKSATGFALRRGRVLRPRRKPSGHIQVSLSRASAVVDVHVHRLVLEAFAGKCPPGLEALHADDVPENNMLTNLRWGTRAENIADRIRNGRNNGWTKGWAA